MPDSSLDPGPLDELLETVGGDREFLRELVDTYLNDTPALLAALTAGLADADAVVVRRAAHTLKSTSATFGATRLAELSREIEAAASADDLAGLGPQVEAVEAEFDLVAPALRAAADDDGPGVETR